jgi:hypothetical protein
MRSSFLLALTLLAGSSNMQAASPTRIFIGSSSTSDTPAQPGSAGTQAAAVANQMEVYAAIALSDRFPCTSSMRPSDVGALLSWERMKTLLDNPTPGAIESIGSALGVQIVVEFQVTQYGGQTTISGSASNAKTGAGVARNTMTIPNDGNMANAMEAFANSFVATMGGGIECDPSTGWKGTVTITSNTSGKLTDQKNNPAQGTSNFNEECDVKGPNAHCTVTFTSSASAKDSSYSSQANGTADTSVSVTTYKGRTAIQIGTVKIKGTNQLTIAGMDASSTTDFSWGPWIGEGPSTQSGNSFSGSSTVNGTTISWNLSR